MHTQADNIFIDSSLRAAPEVLDSPQVIFKAEHHDIITHVIISDSGEIFISTIAVQLRFLAVSRYKKSCVTNSKLAKSLKSAGTAVSVWGCGDTGRQWCQWGHWGDSDVSVGLWGLNSVCGDTKDTAVSVCGSGGTEDTAMFVGTPRVQ